MEARGRKIDEMRERESYAPERERGRAESQYREEREKIIYTDYSACANMHGYCSNLQIYTNLHPLMWVFFFLKMCKINDFFFHFTHLYTFIHPLTWML